jgi:hypothetical protein
MLQKTSLQLIQALNTVQHQFHSDPNWDLLFSNGKNKWYYLAISVYQDVYYIMEGINSISIEIKKDGNLNEESSYENATDKNWIAIFNFAIEHIATVKKNWVLAYATLNKNFPYKYRKGIIHHRIVRYYCKDLMRVDKELGLKRTAAFIKLVESGKLSSHDLGEVTNLTANKFFDYCKVAYLNSNLKLDDAHKVLSGRELYKVFADGRHEGLLDIKQNSVTEFKQWMDRKHPKYNAGGHPWEILRGGNTTHISLYVSKNEYGKDSSYKLTLQGNAMSRLAETLKIYLGLYNAKLTVDIGDPKEIRNRLLGQDNIGIVPEFQSLHRANQSFDDESVHDAIHLYYFKTYQKEIINLASWELLPCLMPL